jgi:ATP-dependent helicase HrpA
VVATNVAETSVTVPGIRTVVDAGLARIAQYNPRAKTTSLPIVPIAKAASAQRAGRCGRTGPGLCIRLYSEEDFNNRPEYTEPELKRANLAEVVLQMIALGLGTPEEFPFLDPPGKPAIREGYQLLRELGAINGLHRLTDRGKVMAGLPIDPCISRIILEAGALNCLHEIKIIAAALAIQDPRNRPPGQEKTAAAAQEIFAHSQSDFVGLLNIWTQCHQGGESGSSLSRLKKFCKNHYLSFQRMREWIDLHEQLCRITNRLEGLSDNSTDASYQQIHQALLSGFVRNIALKKQGKIYQGANNRELMIFPGSQQFNRGGQWLVAATFLETSRLYALTVGTIEAEWVEAAAGHLCNYSWMAVRWHKKTGQVLADERVALFGLILVTGRQVNFPTRHRKNIALAREIFIAAALVEGEINGSYDFLAKNQALLEKWREAEEKLRTRSIVIDQTALYNWYAARLPADVYDQRSLNRFFRVKSHRTSLLMSDSDVLLRIPEEKELVDFPGQLAIGRMEIRLEYLFEPGSPRDGVTFRLPLDFARTVSAKRFEWLVPGLLEEKIHFLLRSLPKGIRKKLVPLRETVLLLLDDIDQGRGTLLTALEASVLKNFRLQVRRSDWPATLPDHLRPHFVLLSSCGEEISAGRDLATLLGGADASVSPHAPVVRSSEEELIGRWQGSEHSSWNFTGLPASLPFYTKAGDVAGFYFPMLLPQPGKGCVRIEFTPNRRTALEATFQGNLYLYSLQFSDQAKAFKKYTTTEFSGPATLWLEKALTGRQEMVETLRRAVLSTLFAPLSGEIVDQQIFQATLSRVQGGGGLYRLGRQLSDQLLAVLRKRREVAELIRKVCGPGPGRPVGDRHSAAIFAEHLHAVFPVEILSSGAPLPFTGIDRQLQGLRIRLDRFHADPGKDRKKSLQISVHLENLKKLDNPAENLSEEMIEAVKRYRELINEFRIALFSPEIKTAEPVSPAKLNDLWRSIQVRY